MNPLEDLAWSLCVPGYAFLFWGLACRILPGSNADLRAGAATAMAFMWVQAGGAALSAAWQLSPVPVLLWLGAGGAAAAAAGRNSFERQLPTLLPLLLLLPYLAMAAAPPWYRDSLTYHLALPRIYANSGGYAPTDEIVFSFFPLAWQSGLAMLHSLGQDGFPPFNPRMVTAWLSGGTALATAGLARLAGAEGPWPALAAACFLLVPTQIEFGTSCYVMEWMTLLCVLAVAGRSIGGERGVLIAGVSAGFAASTKYSGLFVVLLIGLSLFRRPREAARFIGWSAAFGCPFYIRNMLQKGNPFFPLGYDWFGGEGWSEWRHMAYSYTLADYGMGREALDYLLLPFRAFTTTDMNTAFQGSAGPLAGFAFCLMLWAALKRREEAWLAGAAFCTGWLLLWAGSVQQIRFLVPAVPISLAFAAAAMPAGRARLAGIPILIGAMAWAASPAGELWSRQHTREVLAGELGKDEFLDRMLPENHPIYRRINQMDTGKIWLVWMREYAYYLDPPARIDSVFGAWRWEEALEAPSNTELLGALERDGISHVLINHRFFLVDGNADYVEGRTEKLQARFNALLGEGALYAVDRNGPALLYEVSSPVGE